MALRSTLAVAAAGLVAFTGLAADAQAAKYGCFKVTASSLNIRKTPHSTADVISVVHKGDILEKRKLFCTPRGFWCAIRKDSLEGYADKSNMEKIACP
jgi:hypothetical protein